MMFRASAITRASVASSACLALAWRRRAASSAAASQDGVIPLIFVAESAYLPADGKPVSKDGSGIRGEDAHFVSARGLGVADGVGGWVSEGVDPGIFARRLMAASARSSAAAESNSEAADPLPIMRAGQAAVANVRGSSTALVATTGSNGILRVLSLGDSGMALWRRASGAGGALPASALPVHEAARLWHVVAATTPQTFAFNAPLQMGPGPEYNQPSEGQTLQLTPRPGDLVIAATDGLYDNIGDETQAALLAKFDWAPCAGYAHAAARRWREDGGSSAAGAAAVPERMRIRNVAEGSVTDAELGERERLCRASLRGMATMLAMTAHRVGHDPNAQDTPFAREAAKAGMRYRSFRGGKPDDVTVVVAMLLPDAAAVQA